MRINDNNKDIVNQIHIHDSIFDGYTYRYNRREISLVCKQINFNNQTDRCRVHYFNFNNVVSCHMQSCFFWGGGSNILNIYYKDNDPQLMQLIERQETNKELYSGSYLDRGIKYLIIALEINSGDVLTIICENIDYEVEE